MKLRVWKPSNDEIGGYIIAEEGKLRKYLKDGKGPLRLDLVTKIELDDNENLRLYLDKVYEEAD